VPQNSDVLSGNVSFCVAPLENQLTLFCVQMWSIGCMASYTDSGVEPQLGVICGLWEWKQTIGIVDKKTRKQVRVSILGL
jgi:hypothetical protein